MRALCSARFPLEDLHNRAVLGLAYGHGMVCSQSLGAKQRNMFAGELQQVRLIAGYHGKFRNREGGERIIATATRQRHSYTLLSHEANSESLN
jgi:hypothetical protein